MHMLHTHTTAPVANHTNKSLDDGGGVNILIVVCGGDVFSIGVEVLAFLPYLGMGPHPLIAVYYAYMRTLFVFSI